MRIVDEKDLRYRFGDSGPKYLMRGPRSSFAIVQFMPGQDFQAHYHDEMEENFYVLEGSLTIVVDGKAYTLNQGQFINVEPGEVHYVLNRADSVLRMVSSLAPFREADKTEVENPQI